MAREVVRNKKQDGIDRSRFLTSMGLVMLKYKISWDDISIDTEKGIIDVKTDLKPEVITEFLTDIHKIAGPFD